jgi:sugar lactone lactonase YvrE
VDKGRTIREWKLPASKQSGCEGRSWFEGLAWSPDGRLLAASLEGQGIWMWEAATGKELWHAARNGVIAFAPDGKTLVNGGWDQCLTFQDPITGKVQSVLMDDKKITHAVAFSPDGSMLATSHQENQVSSQDCTICLRDPATGRVRRTLKTHHFIPFSISFSADSKWLASSGIDGSVCVWEAATATEILRRAGHNGWVRQVEFGPDGRTVLSASDDLTALLWSLHRGQDRGGRRPLERLWSDLASEPAKAHRATWEFTDDPRAAATFLRKKMGPVKIDIEERRLQSLLNDLDSDDFNRRELAGRALAAMGKAVEGRLRSAMAEAKSVEVRLRLRNLLDEMKREPTPEDLRLQSAVQVMELCGTADALHVLREWSGGTAGAPLTEQARASLERLASGAASGRR